MGWCSNNNKRLFPPWTRRPCLCVRNKLDIYLKEDSTTWGVSASLSHLCGCKIHGRELLHNSRSHKTVRDSLYVQKYASALPLVWNTTVRLDFQHLPSFYYAFFHDVSQFVHDLLHFCLNRHGCFRRLNHDCERPSTRQHNAGLVLLAQLQRLRRLSSNFVPHHGSKQLVHHMQYVLLRDGQQLAEIVFHFFLGAYSADHA